MRNPPNFKSLSPQNEKSAMNETLESTKNECGIYISAINREGVLSSKEDLKVVSSPIVKIEKKERVNSSKLSRDPDEDLKYLSPKQLKRANEQARSMISL